MVAAETDGVLVAGGDAGLLMRSMDWRATPLGALDTWSQTLKSMVRLLLRTPSPLSLWWGPELVQLYNDAYRPILGDKHPRAMAQPARCCFRETWDVVGPLIEAPARGERATTSDDLCLLVERNGFLEEAHFKVAYSPVPDETVGAARVGGVLGTFAEITEQVCAERQLRTLRELRALAGDATTADEACRTAAAALAENAWDVPFALFYLLDDTGKAARLVSNVGFGAEGCAAAPARIEWAADDVGQPWPLGSIPRGQSCVFEGIDARFEALPSGRWSAPARMAIALSLDSPGLRHAYGVLVCGVSPHRALDERYRGFFELAAAQVVTAIRNACARQEERRLLGSGHLPREQLRSGQRGPAESCADALAPQHEHWVPDVARPSPPRTGAPPSEADVRVLVAEADAELRDSIARTLRARWTVMAVADGDGALDAAREWQPDLVLTDVRMSGLSGYGLLSELRKDARTRACPVLMFSARAGESPLEALEAGASDYLVKPFSARELVARVATQVQFVRLRKVAEAERARLFSFLMQLPVAIAACEGPNHVVTLKNPLVDPLTQGRLRLGATLSDVCSEFSLKGLVEVLDRVYFSGEPAVWREQPLSLEREDGGCEDRLYDLSLQPLRDAHGTVTGIVAAAYEVIAPLSTRRRKEVRRRELAAAMAREQAEEITTAPWQTRALGSDVSAYPSVSTSLPLPAVVLPHEIESVALPSGDDASASVGSVLAPASLAATPESWASSGEPCRVLVVDDDRDAAALLEEALVELGYSVAVAHDGPSALQAAQAFCPDTALVDVGLPGMDGFELGRRLRAARAVPGGLRLVAITGYGRESDRRRSQQAGFDLHLVKPVALEALNGAVLGGQEWPLASRVEESGLVVNDHEG